MLDTGEILTRAEDLSVPVIPTEYGFGIVCSVASKFSVQITCSHLYLLHAVCLIMPLGSPKEMTVTVP